ncbi:hypothetical protein PO431_26340 [Escherichia coli]
MSCICNGGRKIVAGSLKKVSGAAKPCGHFRSTRYRVASPTVG